jgi:hypothetical protein
MKDLPDASFVNNLEIGTWVISVHQRSSPELGRDFDGHRLTYLLPTDFAFTYHTLTPVQSTLDSILWSISLDRQQPDNGVTAAGQTIEPPAGEIFYGLADAEFMF